MSTVFDEVICRLDSDASKWNIKPGGISMGIADMDFKVAPEIVEALEQRARYGIFGYQDVPHQYFENFQTWWKKHHHTTLDCEWMLYSNGVIAAIASMIRCLSKPQDQIVLLSPVYSIFYNIIKNNGRNVLASEMLYDTHRYEIDMEDLEQKLRQPNTTMMILCNPHNPTGTIWDKQTLATIGALCAKYHVLVMSDEVHCDITKKGCFYTPFLSVDETCKNNSITCLSVSKAFNLAGLKSACIVCPNETIRNTIASCMNDDEIIEPNSFACDGAIAALEKGEAWLDECLAYVAENRKLVDSYFKKEMPWFTLVDADATYLLWVDCRKLCDNTDAFCAFLETQEQLYVSKGSAFGKSGEGFLRINAACAKSQLLEALHRLKEGSIAWQKNMK